MQIKNRHLVLELNAELILLTNLFTIMLMDFITNNNELQHKNG